MLATVAKAPVWSTEVLAVWAVRWEVHQAESPGAHQNFWLGELLESVEVAVQAEVVEVAEEEAVEDQEVQEDLELLALGEVVLEGEAAEEVALAVAVHLQLYCNDNHTCTASVLGMKLLPRLFQPPSS